MSTEDPVIKESDNYRYALYILILIWSIVSLILSDYAMLRIRDEPFFWIMLSSTLYLGIVLQTSIIARKMKASLITEDIEWDMRSVYATWKEFQRMVSEYTKSYSFATVTIDYPLLSICILLITSSISIPLLISTIFPFLLTYMSGIFTVQILAFGYLCFSVFYRYFPNALSKTFKIPQTLEFEDAIRNLENIEAISWLGVRCEIGEYRGYYTIPLVEVVGMVENFEGVIGVSVKSKEEVFLYRFWVKSTDSSQDADLLSEQLQNPTHGEVSKKLEELKDWYLEHSDTDGQVREMLDSLSED